MKRYKRILSEFFNQDSLFYDSPNCLKNLIGKRKIILYGAGSGFYTFQMFISKKYKIKPYLILDKKFKSKNNFFGMPALSPSIYRPNKIEKNNLVIITVGKKRYHREIFSCLYRLGFQNIILASNIYEYHLLITPQGLKEKGFDYYIDNKEKIFSALELFSDDLSGEIYVRTIQSHLQRRVILIPHRPSQEQYFPKDIKLGKGYSCYINCGGYNGDTIKRLNSLFGKVETLVCFEPDIENFKLLVQYIVKNYKKIAENLIVFPFAVYDQEGIISFDRGYNGNSMICEDGNSFIQCVTLDNILYDIKPTFISMDIEGAEMEALKGATKLLKRFRPDLAIAVYHSPNHIWEIPLYLRNLDCGYKLYLRNYTGFLGETVLYATTKC